MSDSGWFAEFYRQHYRLVLTVAQQRLASFPDSEDAAAEVFRIAWTHYCAGGDLTLPWLYQTLRNVIGNRYRSIRRQEALTERLTTEGGISPAPRDDNDDLYLALSELKEDDREVLAMHYWEDLTGREIAGILRVSETAVRLRIMRAKRRLRRQLDAIAERNVS